ncbi:MAG TPA: hypothetical protein PLZ15_15330 [Melioribacteraceae bacterium]|nr:hypothetical protein [Melioribacteraceae bacterium]
MNSEQEKSRSKALKRARMLANYTSYVAVVESEGKYDIEFEPPFIRPFEKLLVEYSNHKLVKRYQNDKRRKTNL